MKSFLVQRYIHTRLHKPLARLILSYGIEVWTISKIYGSRITASKINFIRKTLDCTKWDHKKKIILKKLNFACITLHSPMQKSFREHAKWKHGSKITRALFNYQASGSRSMGRPMKRWVKSFCRLQQFYQNYLTC